MLVVVESKTELKKAHLEIQEAFQRIGEKPRGGRISFHGGFMEAPVIWVDQYKIWHASRSLYNRYWNGFGTTDSDKGEYTPVCEINFPKHGIDRRIGGVIAVDGHGRTILAHRGKIGGGRKGIGRKAFWKHYLSKPVFILDGDHETKVAAVAQIGAADFVLQVAAFVKQVELIKAIAESEGTKSPLNVFVPEAETLQVLDLPKLGLREPFEEFTGKKRYSLRREVISECYHGAVIEALIKVLRGRGHLLRKDKHCDLCVLQKSQVTAILEVKTSRDLQSFCTGIGQLILYSAALRTKPCLCLVAPKGISRDLKSALADAGIQLVEYRQEGERILFSDLAWAGL